MDKIVIFDFDCTIIDLDSDPWVAQQLGASELFQSLHSKLPWNDMMDALMAALHAGGKTISDIEESLRAVPLQSEKISAIKAAHALGCDLRIVSDANNFFIKTILDKHQITHLFTQIHTNPAHVDEEGRLHIGKFHPKSEIAHGCPLCPANMCKGRIIDQIRAAIPAADTKRIIYAGDGCGDFCPSLRLGVRDCILPREGYPLLELLTQNAAKVKGGVFPWKNAKEMEETLLDLLDAQEVEVEYGACGACATYELPHKLDQACEVVSQIV